MEDIIYSAEDEVEILNASELGIEIDKQFPALPKVAKPLLDGARDSLRQIERALYAAPAFINMVKASIPEEVFRAILTEEQRQKIVDGALQLMTKKDGTLMANLVDPKTKKIVSTVALEGIKNAPELAQAMATYSSQMQMAQIAEQIQQMQLAIEEVRQGQEFDRLSTAYSCQQKLLQAMAIQNPELKRMALLSLVAAAEDSRNLLMQSQQTNVRFICDQPESFWGKLLSGAKSEKINMRIAEIRDSVCAVNMVSFAEAMAYQEMGEPEAARVSLQYYADYVRRTYLEKPGLVQRLDLIDPSPENYWSKTLPDIERKIQALPCNTEIQKLGDGENEREKM